MGETNSKNCFPLHCSIFSGRSHDKKQGLYQRLGEGIMITTGIKMLALSQISTPRLRPTQTPAPTPTPIST